MPRPTQQRRGTVAVAALVAVAAIAVACLGAAGCGGGDDAASGPDRTEGLAPAQILAQARTAAAGVTSFRFTIDATTRSTAIGTPSGAAALFSGDLDISGEGRAARPKRMSVDVQVTAQGIPFQANLTRVDDALYLTVLGRDFRLATAPSVLAPSRPERMPSAVLAWVERPREAGRETVDGVPTVHLTGTVGSVALTDLAGQISALDGEAFTGSESAATLRRGTVDAWIGTQDLLPRRVAIDLTTRSKLRALPEVSSITLKADVGFAEFDEPVEITAPPDARPLDLNDLGSLVGG